MPLLFDALIEGYGPPQEHEENWFLSFYLKLCIEIGLNESSLSWKFQIFWLIVVWNGSIRICRYTEYLMKDPNKYTNAYENISTGIIFVVKTFENSRVISISEDIVK